MEWAIFSTIFAGVGPSLIGSVDALVAALQGWMRPILLAGVPTAIMASTIWKALKGDHTNPMGQAVADAIAGGLIVYMATEAAGLGLMARNLALTGLSNEMGMLITGSMSTAPINAQLFDAAWNKAYTAGLDTFANLPWSGKGLGLAILVVGYWVISALCIGISFMIWMTSFILLALMISLWPVGIGMFAFAWTRGAAWGYVRITTANILLQVMVVTLMSVTIAAQNRSLSELYSLAMTNTNEMRRVQLLIGAGLIVVFVAWLSKQLPGLAATMAHGFTGFGQVPKIGNPFSGGGNNSPIRPQIQPPNNAPQLGFDGATGNAGGANGMPPISNPVPRSTPPGRALG